MEEIYKMEQYEAARKRRMERAGYDLIGTLIDSEVYDLLGFGTVMTARESESWAAFSEAFENAAGDIHVNARNDVEDKARDFGNEREETGFRIGFHTAMRLCMEGLNGGVI